MIKEYFSLRKACRLNVEGLFMQSSDVSYNFRIIFILNKLVQAIKLEMSSNGVCKRVHFSNFKEKEKSAVSALRNPVIFSQLFVFLNLELFKIQLIHYYSNHPQY